MYELVDDIFDKNVHSYLILFWEKRMVAPTLWYPAPHLISDIDAT